MGTSPLHACRSLSLNGVLSALHDETHVPPCLDDLVYILLRCKNERDWACASQLHAYLRKSGLENHKTLGNYLIPLLVDVGNMDDAQQVFDIMVHPNAWSWEALITGYIRCGYAPKALKLYERLEKNESICLSGRALTLLLKTCIHHKDITNGMRTHCEISRLGSLESDVFVGSMLVDLYMKCGLLTKALQVFRNLPVQDVVCWTTIIGGYAAHGFGQQAVNCYDLMCSKGVCANSVTFVCILKACGNIKAIEKIREIHLEIEEKGLLQGELVGNTLIDAFVTCGRLTLAQQVFRKLPKRDVVSWNSMLKGYVDGECYEEALKCYEQMQVEGLSPSAVTFVSSLKACGGIGFIEKGEEIRHEVEKQGLLVNPFIGGALVMMYVKCGSLCKARQVFDKLPERDVVLWTGLIAGYVEQKCDKEALELFEQMQKGGVFPNAVTLISIVKACANVRGLDKGCEVHAEIERQGLVKKDRMVGNSLVDMYGKFGALIIAQEVFDGLPDRDIVSWNVLIGGYTEHGFVGEALLFLEQMQVEGVSPDAFTFVYCLKACGSIQDGFKGAEIHRELERQGLLEMDIIGNALIDMYAKCGMLNKAQKVFDKLPVRDVISWTALITGYAELGDGENALRCFDKMRRLGVSPNAVTLLGSLKACGSIGALVKGADVHSEIERQGLLQRDLVVGNTLVDMYARCGLLDLAQQVFDRLPVCDVVSWNVLLAGYTEQGNVEDALLCFEDMQVRGVHPNSVTFLCILKACGSIGATDRGGRIHAEIERRGLLDGDLVGNTLVNMYAKCGSLNKAMQVFEKLPVRDVVSWTTLMAGYAETGESENVFHIFDQMLGEGVKPNPVTFVVVLTACTRKGLFSECHTYFEAMSTNYGVFPNLEHHACVVNLLGRRGELDMAISMIEKMPFTPNVVLWHTVLGACKSSGSVQFGKQVFSNAMHVHNNYPVVNSYHSCIYANGEPLDEVNKTEAMIL